MVSVLGVIVAYQSCGSDELLKREGGGSPTGIPGALFEGVPIGLVTCALSLGTNILATLLVAYKAWYVCKTDIGSWHC